MTELEYWKERCRLAEVYINICPFDPELMDITVEAYNNWEEFYKNNYIDNGKIKRGAKPKWGFITE